MNSEFALALHCLLLLANNPGELLTSTMIAQKVSVHPVRVRKILSLLKKAHYIDSCEGTKGGFSTSCDPARITLDEIYRLTQKDVLKPKCHSCRETCKIGANIEDLLIDIFSQADNNLQQFLQKFTLEDILNKLHHM